MFNTTRMSATSSQKQCSAPGVCMQLNAEQREILALPGHEAPVARLAHRRCLPSHGRRWWGDLRGPALGCRRAPQQKRCPRLHDHRGHILACEEALGGWQVPSSAIILLFGIAQSMIALKYVSVSAFKALD